MSVRSDSNKFTAKQFEKKILHKFSSCRLSCHLIFYIFCTCLFRSLNRQGILGSIIPQIDTRYYLAHLSLLLLLFLWTPYNFDKIAPKTILLVSAFHLLPISTISGERFSAYVRCKCAVRSNQGWQKLMYLRTCYLRFSSPRTSVFMREPRRNDMTVQT